MIKGYYKDYKISIKGSQMLAMRKDGECMIIGDRKAVSNEIDNEYRTMRLNSSDLTKFLLHSESKVFMV